MKKSLVQTIFLTLILGCASQPPKQKEPPVPPERPHCFRVSHRDGSTTVCHQITQESFYRADGAPCPCGLSDTAPVTTK